jgi:hypothetical protein
MQQQVGFSSHMTVRVTDDFMPEVHLVARQKGLTSASFIRMAVIEALEKAREKSAA